MNTINVTSEVIAPTIKNGGVTISTVSGKNPSGGFAVATGVESMWIPKGQNATSISHAIEVFMARNSDILAKEGMFLGTWMPTEGDGSDIAGKICLDVTEVVSSEEEALRRGRERGEISVFDLQAKHEIMC